MLDIYVLVSYLSLEIHSLGHSSVVEFLFSMWKAVVTTQVPLKKYIIEIDDCSGKVGRTRFVWKFLLHIVFIYINALEIFFYLNSHLLCGSCIISFVSSLLFSTSILLLLLSSSFQESSLKFIFQLFFCIFHYWYCIIVPGILLFPQNSLSVESLCSCFINKIFPQISLKLPI